MVGKRAKKNKIYRQGDVLLIEKPIELDATALTKRLVKQGFKKQDKCILAYGEVTGHTHQVYDNGTLWKDGNGLMVLQMTEKGKLKHEEHAEIELDEGEYQVVNQREFDVMENKERQVID